MKIGNKKVKIVKRVYYRDMEGNRRWFPIKDKGLQELAGMARMLSEMQYADTLRASDKLVLKR